MDRVGVEPTTLASQPYCSLGSGLYTYDLSTTGSSYVQRKLYCSSPALSIFAKSAIQFDQALNRCYRGISTVPT
ncbi:MAG: hypothetical protein M3136_06070 [Thermoproteota archaeon]|nr:hypothetical protein [Thermoproteota archaeon]